LILHSSALLSVLYRGSDHIELLDKMRRSSVLGVSAPTLVEVGMVLQATLGDRAAGLLDRLLIELGIDVVDFGEAHWREAIDAFRSRDVDESRSSFSDYMTYAVSRVADQPVLVSGAHLRETDLELG
jgi:ribonuclease VapC